MRCVSREPRQSVAKAVALLMTAFSAAAVGQGAPETLPAAADDSGLKLSLSTGASYSDNIERVPVDEETGSIGLLGVQLDYREKTRRIDAEVNVDATYQHYFDDNFDNDILGGGDASLTFGFVPDTVQWIVEENFGQVASDPFAAITPDNRENINYFTTGPDFFLHFGSDTWLTLSGRYSDTNYESSEFDGNEMGGTLAVSRRLSSSGTLSLNAEAGHFEFDDEVANPDYDRHEIFARYQIEGARTVLSADVGFASLDIDAEKSDGTLARLTLTRRMSTSSTLNVNAGQQFSNSGDLFRGTQGAAGSGAGVSRVNGSGDPFENTFFGAGYDFSRNRTSIGVSAQYSEEQYETDSSLDRTFTSWNVYLSRHLSSRMDVRIFARLESQEFDVVDFDDDTLRTGASLDWGVGRLVSLRLQYEHYDRDSSDSATEFSENLASLLLIWSPISNP